jgi:hypothetical protein
MHVVLLESSPLDGKHGDDLVGRCLDLPSDVVVFRDFALLLDDVDRVGRVDGGAEQDEQREEEERHGHVQEDQKGV